VVNDIHDALLKFDHLPAEVKFTTASELMTKAYVLTTLVADAENLPDYVRALASGNSERPLDVVDVALADLLSEEQVNDLTSPQPSPFSGENREGRREEGQSVLAFMGILLVIALVAVVVSAFIGAIQTAVGAFSENPAAMMDSIRDIPAPATVDQINETTAVIIGTMAVTTNPVISAEFEAEIKENTHPLEKHGEEAVAVNACIDHGGELAEWVNPDTHRRLKLCQISEGKYSGKYGVQILEENSEWVTSFVKGKMTKLDQVLQYLVNAGYRPF
jgi:hypothetical protein